MDSAINNLKMRRLLSFLLKTIIIQHLLQLHAVESDEMNSSSQTLVDCNVTFEIN